MELEDLRLAVYDHFARTGRAPAAEGLARTLGEPLTAVRAELRELHAQRHLLLDAASRRSVMAHPFTAVPLGFSVMGAETLWWGGCAWDAFALPHLLAGQPELLVATRCPACAAPHAWVVRADAPPPGPQVAHFLVPAARMWEDVVHTCGHQRLFCGEGCVAAWLERTGNARGYGMDIPTLWRLASHWYDGRLDRGYVRREPAAARDYFGSVGLRGAFWGL